MISNDMLLPWLLRRQSTERPFEAFRHWMLTARRVSIVLILLLAYVCYRLLGEGASLATIGQVSFAAIGQLAPAMFGALVWKQANRRGVFAEITDDGRGLLEQMAPTHVAGVRAHLVDLAEGDDLAALGRLMNTVSDQLIAGHPDAEMR